MAVKTMGSHYLTPPVFIDRAIMSLHVSHGSASTPRAAVVTYISSVVNVHLIYRDSATSKASVGQDVIIKKKQKTNHSELIPPGFDCCQFSNMRL